jgi:PTS system fructose-specific IIC component/PTS system nitrogen regulatory IIA component
MQFFQVFNKYSIVNIESTNKYEAFEELMETVAVVQPSINREEALQALITREMKMSTGIMHGIAVPHGLCKSSPGVIGAIGISPLGFDYDALDLAPVHIVFMLLSNPNMREQSMWILRDIALLLKVPNFVAEILQKKTIEAVYDRLNGILSSQTGCNKQEIMQEMLVTAS